MKFVVFLALVVVAVSAKDYTYNMPKFPCSYQMTITSYDDGKKDDSEQVEFSGRYYKFSRDDKIVGVIRPDLGKDGSLLFFDSVSSGCSVEEMEMEVLQYLIDRHTNRLFAYVANKTWDHKDSETYRDKKCDHYYNDEDSRSIYVHDDHIYAIREEDRELVFEYKWKAPMEDFVLSKKDYPKCYEKEKRVADVPSEDYIFCAASTVKIAFVAVVAAIANSLF